MVWTKKSTTSITWVKDPSSWKSDDPFLYFPFVHPWDFFYFPFFNPGEPTPTWTNTPTVSTPWSIETEIGDGWFEFPMFAEPYGFFGIFGVFTIWRNLSPVITEWEVTS